MSFNDLRFKNENKIKICIPIPQKYGGGMYSFLNNWRSWLAKNGIDYTDDPNDQYDILFVNSWAVPESIVKRVKTKQPSVRIVQRVDGSGRDYGRSDWVDIYQARVNLWADLTIFQSLYSKYSTTKKYKVISQDGVVIYNPVDLNLFQPIAPSSKLNRFTVCVVSHSINIKKGTWQISELASKNPEIDFLLVGNFIDLPNLANVKYEGYLSQENLAEVIRLAHVFLHLSENEACPNVVLEALSSGLPVLYNDSGGTPELVGDAGLPIETASFREQLEKIREKHDQYSQKARERAIRNYGKDRIFSQYMEVIRSVQRKPLPTFWEALSLYKQGYFVLPRQPSQLLWIMKHYSIRVKQRIFSTEAEIGF